MPSNGLPPLIVGIGGAPRTGSSSERAVRAVLAAAARRGARVKMFGGADLAQLPYFNPESDVRSASQRALVEAVSEADGLVLGTPGYHAGISGLVKNALDLLQDLRSDPRPYLEGRPVGCIVAAAGWQAGGVTLQALRAVVHALRGWPTPHGLTFNTVADPPFGADGATNPSAAAAIETMATQVLSRGPAAPRATGV